VLLTAGNPDSLDRHQTRDTPIIPKPYQQADLAEKLRVLFAG
jgi:hypothetical protein